MKFNEAKLRRIHADRDAAHGAYLRLNQRRLELKDRHARLLSATSDLERRKYFVRGRLSDNTTGPVAEGRWNELCAERDRVAEELGRATADVGRVQEKYERLMALVSNCERWLAAHGVHFERMAS